MRAQELLATGRVGYVVVDFRAARLDAPDTETSITTHDGPEDSREILPNGYFKFARVQALRVFAVQVNPIQCVLCCAFVSPPSVRRLPEREPRDVGNLYRWVARWKQHRRFAILPKVGLYRVNVDPA